jgi:hypothetical protein
MIEMAASEFVAILQETTLEIAIELTERDNFRARCSRDQD